MFIVHLARVIEKVMGRKRGQIKKEERQRTSEQVRADFSLKSPL